MIQWTSRLYVGERIGKKKDKVISAINNRKAILGVYCIAFASNPNNLLMIMDANELLFPHYRKTNVCIVGLAKGKDEAVELVHEMIMEVYTKTGDFNVRAYFT